VENRVIGYSFYPSALCSVLVAPLTGILAVLLRKPVDLGNKIGDCPGRRVLVFKKQQ